MTWLSDFSENELLDTLLATGAYSTTNIYVSLHDGHPGETGANEVTGGSYARQQTAFGAAASGSATNSQQEDFTSMPATTVFFAGLWDASTVGNFLAAIPLGAGARQLATMATSTETFTAYGHGFANDDRIVVRASLIGDLPTGLSESTIYYVVNSATDTFQLSTSSGGGAAATTTDGEVMCFQVEPRVVNSGDTVQFPIGNITVELD